MDEAKKTEIENLAHDIYMNIAHRAMDKNLTEHETDYLDAILIKMLASSVIYSMEEDMSDEGK